VNFREDFVSRGFKPTPEERSEGSDGARRSRKQPADAALRIAVRRWLEAPRFRVPRDSATRPADPWLTFSGTPLDAKSEIMLNYSRLGA